MCCLSRERKGTKYSIRLCRRSYRLIMINSHSQVQRTEYDAFIEYLFAYPKAESLAYREPEHDTHRFRFTLRASVSFVSPRSLLRHSSSRDQLLVIALSKLCPLVIECCRDHPGSDGHLGVKHASGRIRDCYWRVMIHSDMAPITSKAALLTKPAKRQRDAPMHHYTSSRSPPSLQAIPVVFRF